MKPSQVTTADIDNALRALGMAPEAFATLSDEDQARVRTLAASLVRISADAKGRGRNVHSNRNA